MRATTRVGSRHALLTLFLCFVARRSEAASHEDVNEIRRLREENRQLKSEATRCDSGPPVRSIWGSICLFINFTYHTHQSHEIRALGSLNSEKILYGVRPAGSWEI